MADLFWLSDALWAVMEPFMPRTGPALAGWMTDGPFRALCM